MKEFFKGLFSKIGKFFVFVFCKIGGFFKWLGKKLRPVYVKIKNIVSKIDKIALAFWLNTAFGVFHGVLSFLERSVWFLVLAIYYVSLAIVRGGILTYRKKEGRDTQAQLRAYKRCGSFLIIISLALSIAVIQMVYINRTFSYAGLAIYAVAAYAFYKITIAIMNLVKYKKDADFSQRAVININLANAMVSMLALQTALLSQFGTGETNKQIFNALSGSFVCLFTLGMGIFMVIRASKYSKKLKTENKNERV